MNRFLKWGIGLTIIGLLYIPGYARVQQLKQQSADLRAEIARVKAQADGYAEEIDRLKNDPVHVERVARRDLGLSQKGEIVLEIVEE